MVEDARVVVTALVNHEHVVLAQSVSVRNDREIDTMAFKMPPHCQYAVD
jgi:hypothetical protein